MNTYREIMYMVFDLLKIGNTEESQFTEEHLLKLIDTHRALILKQRYTDITKPIPMINYQTIKVDCDMITKDNGRGFTFYRGKDTLPSLLPVGIVRTWDEILNDGYMDDKISNHTPYNRLRFITKNRYNKSQCYTSIDDLGRGCYLYPYTEKTPEEEEIPEIDPGVSVTPEVTITPEVTPEITPDITPGDTPTVVLLGSNIELPDITEPEIPEVTDPEIDIPKPDKPEGKAFYLSSVFDNSVSAYLYNGIDILDIIDTECPIEERLIKDLTSSIVAVLRESIYLPKDEFNNERNDLDNIPTKK